MALRWITAGTLAALAFSIYLPAAAAIFRFGALDVAQLAGAAALGLAGVAWYEVYKAARPRRRPARGG